MPFEKIDTVDTANIIKEHYDDPLMRVIGNQIEDIPALPTGDQYNITRPEEIQFNIDRGEIDKPQEIDPSFGDTLYAAFQEENLIGSTIANWTTHHEGTDSFNAFYDSDLSGYEDHLTSFFDARSPAEVEDIKKNIDRGNQNRHILRESGGYGIAAQIGAGLLDPTILIPIGGAVYKASRIGQILYNVAKTGLIIGGIETAREAIFHQQQELRTVEESALNIGGATILGGILGGAISAFKKPILDEAAEIVGDAFGKNADDIIADVSREAESAGAAANRSYVNDETTIDDETLVGGKLTEVLSVGPAARLAQSPSVVVRRAGQGLVEDPFLRQKNLKGIANDSSVETDINIRTDAEISDVHHTLLEQYENYLKRTPKDKREIKTFDEFKQRVAKELRRQDEPTPITKEDGTVVQAETPHARSTETVSEVKSTAKKMREKFDRVKDELVETKILPKNSTIKTALSYLPRVYNVKLIEANSLQFEKELADALRKINPDDLELDDYIRETTQDILHNIVGTGRLGKAETVVGKPNNLRGRTLELPDEFLEKWLINDPEELFRNYYKSVVPRLEVTKKFGDAELKGLEKDIRSSYAELIDNAKTQKEAQKLNKQLKDDIDDLALLKDRLYHTQDRGVFGNGTSARVVQAGKKISLMSNLGGVQLTSLPDLARPIIISGVTRYLGMYKKLGSALINDPAFANATLAEKRKLTAALEIIEQTRLSKMADVFDELGQRSTFERGLDYVGGKFSKASLLPYHNSILKQMSGLLTADKIIEAGIKLNKGKVVKGNIKKNLAMLGVDDETAKRVAKQFEKYGQEQNGLKLDNVDQWDDIVAANAYRRALAKNANIVINTPTVGTLPKAMDNIHNSAIFQFKTFLIASWNQTLLAGLQQGDAAFYSSIVGMIGISYGVTQLKDAIAGRDKPKTAAEALVEAVDRSGVLGIPLEINNLADKFSGHRISLQAMVGGSESRRYASRNSLQAAFGPVYGSLADTVLNTADMGSRVAVGDDVTKSDVHRMRRALPFQNLYYMRWLFDEAENGFNNVMGITKGKDQAGIEGLRKGFGFKE